MPRDVNIGTLGDTSDVQPSKIYSTNEVPEVIDAGTDIDEDIFGAMKDDIYREVAVFIANNESYPEFLLSFFRLAQRIRGDSARDQVMQNLRELAINVYEQSQGEECSPDRLGINEIASSARPGSAEYRDRSYDYEEVVEDGTDIPTDDDQPVDVQTAWEVGHIASDTDGEGSKAYSMLTLDDGSTPQYDDDDASGLAVEFRAEIEGNKSIILELSHQLAKIQESTRVFSKKTVTTIVQKVSDSVTRASSSGILPVGEASDQLSIALTKALQRYVGMSIADHHEAVLRHVSNILYDAMIFNKVIQQVDLSYREEISGLQATRNELGLEVGQLQQQREEDLDKLFQERRDVLKKMQLDSERDATRLDNERDDALAAEFQIPETPQQQIAVELTSAEARLPEEGSDVTLTDLPENIHVPGANALAHISKAFPDELV